MNIGINCFNLFTYPKYPAKVSFGTSQKSDPNRLIEENMGLVNKVLRGPLRKQFSLVKPQTREELQSVGLLALCEAANEFDTSSEQSFEEFAKARIYKAIADNIIQNRPKFKTISLYTEIGKKERDFSLIDTISDSKATQLGEDSSEKLVKVPELPDEIKNAILARYGTQIESAQTRNYFSISGVSNYNQSQFDEESRKQLLDVFTAAIEKLPPKLKDIIKRRFLKGEEVKDIAQDLKISRRRCFNRYNYAIDTLRLALYGETPVPKITHDMINYIFEDEGRTKAFLKILDKLPTIQRDYFELRYGITKTNDGEYQLTDTVMTNKEIAKKYNLPPSSISTEVVFAEYCLKKDRDFIKLMADYKKLPPFKGEITPDVIKYIFEDEGRTKAFLKILDKLTSKQRQYFELRYGITKTDNGEYQLTDTVMVYNEIAKKYNLNPSSIYARVISAENHLKADNDFIKLMADYKKPQQNEVKITQELIRYIFEDEERAKKFLKILDKLLPTQRKYFELRHGITQKPDGKYECTGKTSTYQTIANVTGKTLQGVVYMISLVEKKLKSDSSFVSMVSNYRKLPTYEGEITLDLIKYIFEDKERAKKFLKILDNLPPRQRQFFELRYGIIKNTNGEYECTGKTKTRKQIAEAVDCSYQNIHQKVTFFENQLKKDRDFIKMMQEYEGKN